MLGHRVPRRRRQHLPIHRITQPPHQHDTTFPTTFPNADIGNANNPLIAPTPTASTVAFSSHSPGFRVPIAICVPCTAGSSTNCTPIPATCAIANRTNNSPHHDRNNNRITANRPANHAIDPPPVTPAIANAHAISANNNTNPYTVINFKYCTCNANSRTFTATSDNAAPPRSNNGTNPSNRSANRSAAFPENTRRTRPTNSRNTGETSATPTAPASNNSATANNTPSSASVISSPVNNQKKAASPPPAP
ncbi:hypothetical protein [Saccharopolyspora erythraea]|uniref:hypothetical protein n=1 Tax=Saccharopolyspora erythraea TaxID=1836 RepID=UPI0012F86904|nr:hypothetical protein [Saccharopolyspora erythraea]